VPETIPAAVLEDALAALNGMVNGAIGWKEGHAEPPDGECQMYPAWVFIEGQMEFEELAYPLVHIRQPFEVVCMATDEEIGGSKRRDVAAGMILDVTGALMADRSRGGHAMDTRILTAERIPVVAPRVLAIVRGDFYYRTKLSDLSAAI